MNCRHFYPLPILFLAGCFLKDEPEPQTGYLSQGFKHLAYFQDGTYWVYRNPRTRALDSVAVTEFHRWVEEADFGRGRRHRSETFSYVTTSSYDRRAFQYRAMLRGFTVPPDTTQVSFTVQKRPQGCGDCGYFVHLLYQPVAGTELLLGTRSYVKVVQVWPRLTVAGTTFKDVVEMAHTFDETSLTGEPVRHFVAPRVGLVRRDVQVNGTWETWELIRSHIIQ